MFITKLIISYGKLFDFFFIIIRIKNAKRQSSDKRPNTNKNLCKRAKISFVIGVPQNNLVYSISVIYISQFLITNFYSIHDGL